MASSTADIKAHKAALIKAQTDTLPKLFAQIKDENEQMAVWMEAQLLPMQSDVKRLQTATGAIKDRIFTVELYAGLTEELVKIQDGKPADNDTKVSLFQRRHYMDEECLGDYDAGGMDYKKIEDFDAWLLRPHNLRRILPKDRCIVAFRIRRNRKERKDRPSLPFAGSLATLSKAASRLDAMPEDDLAGITAKLSWTPIFGQLAKREPRSYKW